MTTAVATWFVALMADSPIQSGELTLHPMSGKAVLEQPGWPVLYIPDRRVELELTSYAIPTRGDGIDGTRKPVGCGFTLSVDDGKTTAALDRGKGAPECAMGELTSSVVETLGRWRFEVSHEPNRKRGTFWLDAYVYFGEGESIATVDIPQAFVAGKLPPTPFEGLRIVREAYPRVRVAPSLPPDVKGKCALHFWIDAKGVPTDVGVRECSDSVREGALKAAWKWRFDPKLINGEPVDAEFDLMAYFAGRIR